MKVAALYPTDLHRGPVWVDILRVYCGRVTSSGKLESGRETENMFVRVRLVGAVT